MTGTALLPIGTVTFLFSDIEGSTDLVRHAGDDGYATIRADHRRLLRDAFAEYDGHEIDTAGDGFFVVFQSARKAVAAAVGAQLRLAAFAWPTDAAVRVRIGLHTAEPHLSPEGYVGVGVTRASRICFAARGGQILVSSATAGIIEDAEMPGVDLLELGEYELKGFSRKQRLFQLTVARLPSEFGPLRTPDALAWSPGAATFLHSDLSGWRPVLRLLGDEANAAIISDYWRLTTSAVEANGGKILERTGDSCLAVFASASDGLRGAGALRQAIREFAWPPERNVEVAIAVHSGRWSGDLQQPLGLAVYRLSRLARLAGPGQVLVSHSTAALLEGDRSAPPLRSLGEQVIPDFDEPAPVYELIDSSRTSALS
jgi:class 3 adenylate cyclase